MLEEAIMDGMRCCEVLTRHVDRVVRGVDCVVRDERKMLEEAILLESVRGIMASVWEQDYRGMWAIPSSDLIKNPNASNFVRDYHLIIICKGE